jgi:hypothetical protein
VAKFSSRIGSWRLSRPLSCVGRQIEITGEVVAAAGAVTSCLLIISRLQPWCDLNAVAGIRFRAALPMLRYSMPSD